jgi:non-ribosomal peptide synthetase component F
MNSLKTQTFEIQKATNLESSLDIPGVLVLRIYPEVDYADVEAISACQMHVWFEDQAMRNPELIALHWGKRKQLVTYKALNQSANQIAHCQCLAL